MYRLLILLPLVVLLSCHKPPQSDEIARQARTWGKARVSSYEYVYAPRCYCPQAEDSPYTIRVEKGKIISVNGRPHDPDRQWYIYTIDQLFEQVRKHEARNPFQKTISYDKTYGFPAETYFDFYEKLRDDEFGWDIRSFTRL